MAAGGSPNPQAGDDRTTADASSVTTAQPGLIEVAQQQPRAWQQTSERNAHFGEDFFGHCSVPPDRGKDQDIRITLHHRLSRSFMSVGSLPSKVGTPVRDATKFRQW